LQNNANQAVASGFYIYMVTLDDGERIIRQTGKVVVIHWVSRDFLSNPSAQKARNTLDEA